MAKKIMVVDDEPDIRKMIGTILEMEGFDVITAPNGNVCLKKLKKEKVDLVLLDYLMPGMSGKELLEKIREDKDLKSLKVAFLTIAELTEKGKEEFHKMKVLDHIQKPVDFRDMVKRVEKILRS